MVLGKIKASLRNVIYSEGVNPLPTQITIIVFILNLFNSMVMTMVFSFMPHMIKSFGANEVDTGYYAGLLGSSLFISRTIFSICWGYLSDYKGRKFSLLISTGGLMFATLAFGFSMNFYWALIARFLQGAFMGVIVITKAVLADACDDTNFPLGLSFIITSFSVGLIFGPSVAGFLAFPAELYPESFSKDGLFGRFVILLPMLILAVGFAIAFVMSVIYLPRDKKKEDKEISRLIRSSCKKTSYHSLERTVEVDDHVDAYWVISLGACSNDQPAKNKKRAVSLYQIVERINQEPEAAARLSCFSLEEFKTSKIYRVVRSRECMLASAIYGVFSFVAVGQSEMFPLFSATDVQLHGLGFNTSDIGTALLIASVVLIAVQLTMLPRFSSYFGPKKTVIICSITLAFLFPLLPSMAAIQNKYFLWTVLSLHLLLTRTFVTLAFLAINILLNNSVPPDLLGSANGVAMTISSIGRMLAPTVFGSIFSWSLKNVTRADSSLGYPLNQYFTFFVQSVWAILVALLCSILPESMNRRKEEEGEGGKRNGTSSITPSSINDEEEIDDSNWKKTDVSIAVTKFDT